MQLQLVEMIRMQTYLSSLPAKVSASITSKGAPLMRFLVWGCISKACKDVVKSAGVSKEDVKGIGFDATCSLAVSDFSGSPQSVTPGKWGTGDDKFNIILWADHRASVEANTINSSGSSVLKYVGGTVCYYFLSYRASIV